MSFTDYGEFNLAIETGAVIPLEIAGSPLECSNCHGSREMYVFRKKNGPFRSPAYNDEFRGAKWLDQGCQAGWYTGKIEVTPCPACCGGHRAEYLRKMCGLSGRDEYVTLEDFVAYQGKEEARQEAINLLAMNRHPSGFVTFWGSWGVGKSMLLKVLVNGFRLVGELARYTTMANLLEDARVRFGDGNGNVSAETVIEHYRSLPVLCIDEVDRINMTGWARETVHRLMDSRYNARGELLTVLACNPSPEQLLEDFGYLASRMRGGLAVEVGGMDMRPATAAAERADIDG